MTIVKGIRAKTIDRELRTGVRFAQAYFLSDAYFMSGYAAWYNQKKRKKGCYDAQRYHPSA